MRKTNDPGEKMRTRATKTCSQPTAFLQLVLRIQGDLRRALAPIGVTPLQAGVLCYLHQRADSRLIDVAEAFRVEPPTLVDVVRDLVRKGSITKRRSVEDRRALCLRLSRKERGLVREIAQRIEDVENSVPGGL